MNGFLRAANNALNHGIRWLLMGLIRLAFRRKYPMPRRGRGRKRSVCR